MGRRTLQSSEMPNAPSTYEVAPHRYLWDHDSNYRWADSYKEFMAGVPYKEGDVVYIQADGNARKAFIVSVWFERDQFNDRREKYKVLVANKKGDAFSKQWEWTHPGFVQRGYQAAGLAPDIPA